MENRRRKNIASGLFLILLGFAFLAFQIFPALTFTWPMILIFVALGLLAIGLLSLNPDMIIPACIVGGIGGILYFQDLGVLTWQSWAYLWTLIPGFVGVGELLAGLLRWKPKQITEGLETILVSVVMFAIFGSIFGNVFGFIPLQGSALAILLIIVGVFLFIRALISPKK